MNQSSALDKLKDWKAFTPVLVIGILMVVGAIIYNFHSFAATAGFTVSSTATSYKVGDDVTVTLSEDSDTQCANVVSASISYPSDLLRYDSMSNTNSKFEGVVPTNQSNGTVVVRQYTTRKECGTGSNPTSGVSGQQMIAKIHFTALKDGTAHLDLSSSSRAISSADNHTNVAPEQNNLTLTLTGSGPVSPPSPNPQPSGNGGDDSGDAATPVTHYTPDSTSTPVGVEDGGTVQLNEPANVEPTPILPDGVSQVDYFLDGKLLATETKSPFTYHLDTSKLLNGRYVLKTVTHYENGQTKTVSQTVVVNNKFGLTQFKLRLKKLLWLVILIVLLLIAAVAAWLTHRRRGGGGTGSGQSYDYNLVTSSEIPVVVPPSTGSPTGTDGMIVSDGGSSDDANIIRPTKN